jgi:g-D-glutamyl-meso-diaminopimelate peptidase
MTKFKPYILTLLIIFSFFSIGQTYVYSAIIDLSQGEGYSSSDLYQMALKLESKYPYIIHVEVIGKSVDQKPLFAVIMTDNVDYVIQRDDFNVYRQHYLVEAGTHSRETVNPIILMKQIEDYAIDYTQDDYIPEFNLSEELEDVIIHFLPLTNPDGFDLVKFGKDSIQTPEGLSLLLNVDDYDYTNYKAGITGVDHNRNYPQEYFDIEKNAWVNIWQTYLNDFYSDQPSGEFYPGPYPASEPEVQTVMDYILSYDFRNYISFHSRGTIIYWNKYFAPDYYNHRTKELAQSVSDVNGYELSGEDTGRGSGYISDFTSSQTLKPLITIETLPAWTKLPTPNHLYLDAYDKNRLIPLIAIQNGKEIGYHPYRLYVDYTYVRDFEDLLYAKAIAQKYEGEIIEGSGIPPMILEKEKRAHSIYELLVKYFPLI